jgi:hypothetical protein
MAYARHNIRHIGVSQQYRMSFLTSNKDNAVYARALAKPDSDRHPSYRYKLSVCYWGSVAGC